MAKWSSKYINDLSDAAFAVVLPGGRKDTEGKTVPRDLRKLPHHTPEVRSGLEHDTVDLPHLRNALSRLPQTLLPGEARQKAREHLERHAKALGVGELNEEAAVECELQERVQAAPGRVADGVIHDVVVLRCESANNRRYPAGTLRRAVGLFEGAKVFANHAPGARDVRDLVGILRSVRSDGSAVRADLEVFEELAGWLLEIARRAPDALGLSINALGRVARRAGGDMVEEITQVRSVDVVAEPASVSGLFEAKKEDSDRIEALEEEKRALSAELERLRQENERLLGERRLEERRRQFRRRLENCGIAGEAAGEEFYELLAQLDDATVERLIAERAGLLRRLERPASAVKLLFGRAKDDVDYVGAIKSRPR